MIASRSGASSRAAAARAALVGMLAAGVCAVAPRAAVADEGEWLVGGEVVGELPAAGGLGAVAQRGLGDALAVRATAGARHDGTRFALDATAGLVWAFDVLVWVPEVFVGAGVRSDSSTSGELVLGLGARRYISLDWSLTFAVSGRYRTDGERYGTLALGLWRRLP